MAGLRAQPESVALQISAAIEARERARAAMRAATPAGHVVPDLVNEQEDLARAERHLREGEARVAEQRWRLEQANAAGQESDLDMRLLRIFEQTLEQWNEHHRNILDRIARASF